MSFIDSKHVKNFLNRVIPRSSIFTVTFHKKDGTERRMTCQRDVRVGLKGGTSTIKAKKNLVSVYDHAKKGYRCFDVSRVLKIVAEGYVFQTREYAKA